MGWTWGEQGLCLLLSNTPYLQCLKPYDWQIIGTQVIFIEEGINEWNLTEG